MQNQDGRRLVLSLCKDVSNGVAHLHQANVIPNDLGARTCQITSQLIVKVSFDIFPLKRNIILNSRIFYRSVITA